MEKENEYMQRMIDWKKVWLLYMQRAGLILWMTIFTAVMTAGIYNVIKALHYEGQFYRVSSDYYITFNFDEYETSVDYYNAYTWDSILRDDPIVDEAVAILNGKVSKEQVKETITGEMLGDYRILTVHATSKDPEIARMVSDAYVESLKKFADKIEMLDAIELWSQEELIEVKEENLTANATLLGAFLGIVFAVFAVAFWCLMDDSIYLEQDFTQRFQVPFLGMLTKKKAESAVMEVKENLHYLCKEGQYYLVSIDENNTDAISEVMALSKNIKGSLTMQGEDLNVLRKSSGAILLLSWGNKNGRRCEKAIRFLEKQDCRVAGAVLINADDTFLKKYYFGRKKQETK